MNRISNYSEVKERNEYENALFFIYDKKSFSCGFRITENLEQISINFDFKVAPTVALPKYGSNEINNNSIGMASECKAPNTYAIYSNNHAHTPLNHFRLIYLFLPCFVFVWYLSWTFKPKNTSINSNSAVSKATTYWQKAINLYNLQNNTKYCAFHAILG